MLPQSAIYQPQVRLPLKFLVYFISFCVPFSLFLSREFVVWLRSPESSTGSLFVPEPFDICFPDLVRLHLSLTESGFYFVCFVVVYAEGRMVHAHICCVVATTLGPSSELFSHKYLSVMLVLARNVMRGRLTS